MPLFLLYNRGNSVNLERLETICTLCLAHVDTQEMEQVGMWEEESFSRKKDQ